MSYYEFIKNGKNYIKINDIEYGPQGKIIAHKFSSNTNWHYIYTDPEDPLKQYLRLNGQPPIGPYQWIDENYVLRNEQGSTGFIFQKGDGYYVYVNGKEIGPYSDRYLGLQLIGNVDYIFYFNKKGKQYLNLSNKIIGPYDIKPFSVKALDAKHYFFQYRKDPEKPNDWHININGKENYGPYQHIYAHFDENKSICIRAIKEENGKRTTFIRSRNISYGPYSNAYFLGNSSDFRFRDENGNSFEVIADKTNELRGDDDIVLFSNEANTQTLRFDYKTGEIKLNNKKLMTKFPSAFGFVYSETQKCFYFFSLDDKKILRHILR